MKLTEKRKMMQMNHKYRYLLFDLDGTLTNPKTGITRSVQHALRHFGIEEPDTEKLVPFIGPPLVDSFMRFYGFSREQALEGVQYYREYFAAKGILENEVIDGIPERLGDLQRAGRILAVASSKPEPYVIQILEAFDLLKYFSVITGTTMDETRTDKREVIEETCRRLRLANTADVLMVGDREHDIIGARQFGIDSMGVYIGFAAPGELERAGATMIAHSVEEMRAQLLREKNT